jgi:hypothetical protein
MVLVDHNELEATGHGRNSVLDYARGRQSPQKSPVIAWLDIDWLAQFSFRLEYETYSGVLCLSTAACIAAALRGRLAIDGSRNDSNKLS